MLDLSLYVRLKSERLSTLENQVKVSPALVDEALTHKGKLVNMVEYQLGDDPEVALELASIKSGTGYFDVASDLTRLARAVETHKAILELDLKHYQPDDAPRAMRVAKLVVDELGQADTRDKAWNERYAKVWAVLCHYYNEVTVTGQYIFRNTPNANRFRNLAVAARTQRKAKAVAPVDVAEVSEQI